jgi:hypothetical protein
MPISEANYLAMKARLEKGKTLCQVFAAEESGLEKKLHERILEFCKENRWLFIHSRMDAPATVALGVPDFILLAPQGRVFLIECKTLTGKLSIAQMAFGIMAEQLGHRVHLIRSYTQFLELIKS